MSLAPEFTRETEPLGVRLRRLRLTSGLSQRELSSPGVSYAYISRIEAGARTPSVKALRMLARKLSVSVEYLETGSDIRDVDERELRLADAELELRLADDQEAAERKLEAILEEAQQAGDGGAATRARIGIGLAAAARGNHLDAVEQLERAVADHPIAPAARPDVYATLGRSYAALGAPERAVRLFERCLGELIESVPEDTDTQIRFATFLSNALSDAGEYARAAEVVKDALHRADTNNDSYTRIRLHWSLARTSGLEGRSSDSLEHMRRAIALLEETDHNLQLARAYLLSAGIEWQGQRGEEAQAHLDHAERLFGAQAEAVDRGMLWIGGSRLAALDGDGDNAVELARSAMDVLGDSNGTEQGAAVWALGEGLALQGDVDSADHAFRRAVDLLSVNGRRHDAALACASWSRFLQKAGRDDEAARVRQRATDLGLSIQPETAG